MIVRSCERLLYGVRFAVEKDAEKGIDSDEEALVGGLVHAEHESRHHFLLACGDLSGDPLVLVHQHSLDLAVGQFRGDCGDLLESGRRAGGDRGRTFVGAVRGEDDGRGLGCIGARRPGDRPIGGYGDDASLAPRPGEPSEAVRIEAVAKRRPRDAGLGEQLLGAGVVTTR